MKIPEAHVGSDGLCFRRKTIIDCAYGLTALGKAGLNRMLLDLDLNIDQSGSLDDRANAIARFALVSPDSPNATAQRLDYEIVLRAAKMFADDSPYHGRMNANHAELKATLEGEGFDFSEPTLPDIPSGPEEAQEDEPPPPGYVAGEADFTGFRPLYPSSLLNDAPLNTVPFNTPSFRPEITAGVPPLVNVSTVIIPANWDSIWSSQARQIRGQIDEIEGALRRVIDTLAQLEAHLPLGTASGDGPGIGHNLPPEESRLSADDFRQAISASEVLKAELPKRTPDFHAINLCLAAMRRAASFAKWLTEQGRTFVEEAVKSAGQRAGTKAIDLIAFYVQVEILTATVPPLADGLHSLLQAINFQI